MPEYNLPRCPYCQSLNVQPFKKLWQCNDCLRSFEQAMVEQEPPKEKKKGGKK